jgi:hypothetical protein
MLIDENDVELAERMANALERIQERQDECEYDEDAVDRAERMVARGRRTADGSLINPTPKKTRNRPPSA